jgi:hypothetical protein
MITSKIAFSFSALARLVTLTLFCSLFIMTGCSQDTENFSPLPSIDPEVKADLDAPINCLNARRDIATLEEEKASVGKQILSGVRAVFPIAAVSGLLLGDYGDRVEVATGQYNADIDAKIARIRSYCRIN